LNTLSILFVLSVVLHVSLAWMADGMTTDVYRRICVFVDIDKVALHFNIN